MSVFVIGDENTILGFSLIGIDGQVVESVAEAAGLLDEKVGESDVDIILITENWAAEMRDRVNELKMAAGRPLVLEIPGSQPAPSTGPSLRELVEQAVGAHLGLAG